MALYAISDLHLALSTDKPMDIFGVQWVNHDEKIKKNWKEKITEKDTVLIAGDISWSMKHEESKIDLDWINSLPGNKIISKEIMIIGGLVFQNWIQCMIIQSSYKIIFIHIMIMLFVELGDGLIK